MDQEFLSEYIQFLSIAYASSAELETQLMLSKDLGFVRVEDFEDLLRLRDEVAKMLAVLIKKLQKKIS